MSEKGETQKTRFEPPADNPITEEYWAATREKKLMLQKCRNTGRFQFFPRAASIHDPGGPVDWVEASGRGTVYTFSVQHRPANPLMADRVPYTVALVELEEGMRMMTNIVGCAPDAVQIGMPVRLTWEALSDGRHLPLFEPA